MEEDESFSCRDITILCPTTHHIRKGSGNDGGHQEFGVVFEGGPRVLGRRHRDAVDDLVQLRGERSGPSMWAELGEGELVFVQFKAPSGPPPLFGLLVWTSP